MLFNLSAASGTDLFCQVELINVTFSGIDESVKRCLLLRAKPNVLVVDLWEHNNLSENTAS